MENKQFGCEALSPVELQEIKGGGYVRDAYDLLKLTLAKGIHDFGPKVGIGALEINFDHIANTAVSVLLTAYVDPLIKAL